jgi:hypothetical protein
VESRFGRRREITAIIIVHDHQVTLTQWTSCIDLWLVGRSLVTQYCSESSIPGWTDGRTDGRAGGPAGSIDQRQLGCRWARSITSASSWTTRAVHVTFSAMRDCLYRETKIIRPPQLTALPPPYISRDLRATATSIEVFYRISGAYFT